MFKVRRALPPLTFAAVALIAWFTPASQSQADHDSFHSSPTSTNPLYPPALYPTSSILGITPLPSASVPPALNPTSSILGLTPLPSALVPPALYPTSSILGITPLPSALVPPALYPTGGLDGPLSEGQFDDFVSVLSADTVSGEQVSSAVDAILENDISETEAESLAQSEKVLESIDGDQAVEIFASIDLDGLTDTEGAEIVGAVQNADNNVRGAFEDELNIFEGQFDEYVPLNSKINVEDRRTVVAVSVVSTAAVATMGVRSAMPMGGGTPGGGGAELAEAFKSESSRIRRISKYKDKDGRRVVDKKNFSKKLILSIMQNSFTLVGFIVVYLTLSGSVRTIAGIATLVAFFSTLYIDMREGDED